MPFQSEAVANKFVELAGAKGDLTLMKLLKVVYFAHGWHLAITDGKPLIDEYVQAWKFGPVEPSVYHAFKENGAGPITELCKAFEPNSDSLRLITPTMPDGWNPFFGKIWETYGSLTAYQLSQMTHQDGTPWHKAWFKDGGSERKGTVIPDEEIMKYFKSKIPPENG